MQNAITRGATRFPRALNYTYTKNPQNYIYIYIYTLYIVSGSNIARETRRYTWLQSGLLSPGESALVVTRERAAVARRLIALSIISLTRQDHAGPFVSLSDLASLLLSKRARKRVHRETERAGLSRAAACLFVAI